MIRVVVRRPMCDAPHHRAAGRAYGGGEGTVRTRGQAVYVI